jgi:hypothetical protein
MGTFWIFASVKYNSREELKQSESVNKDVHTALIVRGIISKEEELSEVLQQEHIKISAFSEAKKQLQWTKDTGVAV